MDRPLATSFESLEPKTLGLRPRQVVDSSVLITDVCPDPDGGVRVYVGPRWHGHYVVIEDLGSRIIINQAWQGGRNGHVTMPRPPAGKVYCERNGNCRCEEQRTK